LTAKNAPAIAEIGRRLDGIPLALELAAARTRVVPPEQIAAHLDDRFRLLTGGSRTALPRHQTLLALIEWSHELLSEPERMLLRRLAVFAGGFSLNAAQAVGGDGLEAETLETLARLVEKSLVDVAEQLDAAEGRYHLLETVRQFAHAKLLEAGEAERMRDRHLAFYIHFAEEAEPHLRHTEQLAWLEHIEREHDNLRAALGWALESGQRERALRLAGALSYFWELRAYWSEGQKWLNAALTLSAGQQNAVVAGGAVGETVIPPREQATLRAKALYAAGKMRFGALFDFAGSCAMVEESLRLWRELGDTWWTAVALEHVGFMLMPENAQLAVARLEEGVALARELEDRWPLALCLVRLAGAVAATDVAAARRIREEGVAVARSVGDKSVLSQGLQGLAPIYQVEGDLSAAAAVAEEALAEAGAIGSATQVFLSLLALVGTACLQGDLTAAREYCVQALAYARETGASQWLLIVLLALSVVACFGGEAERGVRMLAACQAAIRQRGLDLGALDRLGPSFMIIEQTLEKAQAQLGAAAFETAWAAGQQMTMEQALALATVDESGDALLPSSLHAEQQG
jgi:non-specific serine/threonine protein kinase